MTQYERSFSFGSFGIILWILAGAFVLFLLYNLFARKGLFKSNTAVLRAGPAADVPEEIHGKDFASRVRQAKDAGDWRAATRWLFLSTLQKLEARQMIRFAVDKTNSAYAAEMPEAKRAAFAQLALYYEYIFYGITPVSPEQFAAIEAKFSSFSNSLL